jgi:F-type H+-transporting ATPase subunit b
MTRVVLAAAFLAGLVSPALADIPPGPPPPPVTVAQAEGETVEKAAEAAAHAGAGEGVEHGEAHGEAHEEEGIVNWWSWDYGATAKDPEHKHWPPPFGWALVNFGVFLYLLSRILWRPIKAGIVSRHDQIKGELDEATRLRKQAEAQLAEYAQKVKNVDQEVDALLAQLRTEAEGERARIVAAAETEARRLKAEADHQIKLEIARARAELQRETVEAALKAAEELLVRNVNAADQQKLAERYVGDLEHGTPGKEERS